MNSHEDKNQKFIFIKKKVVQDDTEHTMGAWKIVYADFMTVLMSFFLLMWIVNATDDDTKKVIEEYFNPFGKNLQMSSKGILNEKEMPHNFLLNDSNLLIHDNIINNDSILNNGNIDKRKQHQTLENNIFSFNKSQQSDYLKNPLMRDLDNKKGICKNLDQEKRIKTEENYFLPPLNKQMILEMKRKKRSQELEKKLSSKLSGLTSGHVSKRILFDTTNQGTLISIIEQTNTPMFDKNSSIPLSETVMILQKIGESLAHSKEKISIRGHTDARPFHNLTGDNWKLSLDRAYSAYQVLMRSGITEDRISNISGFAHHHPKIISDPMNPANRRIDILVIDGQG
ncbi:OmpA family protein [Candidatus Liberibacter africanus]|uniref:Flagellar motor protein MotB n=1 Tax=Candidatus Liberibacter africanus PTSAPSY TaxID=1277257 RepID=A0A0G3I9A8_LIBAF|nr:flagellar motor protein MotB [Candidatus Liberibacter africanus]AKK20372.1 flagellar motor protein MotB [Candidatus Liberibacter africanus PTSAPSY]QTP64109.1 OmpA family protein [Candidatus Liberibacter africanus]